jgi:hypothetical protein
MREHLLITLLLEHGSRRICRPRTGVGINRWVAKSTGI